MLSVRHALALAAALQAYAHGVFKTAPNGLCKTREARCKTSRNSARQHRKHRHMQFGAGGRLKDHKALEVRGAPNSSYNRARPQNGARSGRGDRSAVHKPTTAGEAARVWPAPDVVSA